MTSLHEAAVRFVVIGVWGANYHAHSVGVVFTTEDRDLFLPPDPQNELKAWQACRREGLELWCGEEPLGDPLDAFLAKGVVSRRALVRAQGDDLLIDLTLVMAGFEFDEASKAAAGRPKDQLFLATHEDALRQLLGPRFDKA